MYFNACLLENEIKNIALPKWKKLKNSLIVIIFYQMFRTDGSKTCKGEALEWWMGGRTLKLLLWQNVLFKVIRIFYMWKVDYFLLIMSTYLVMSKRHSSALTCGSQRKWICRTGIEKISWGYLRVLKYVFVTEFPSGTWKFSCISLSGHVTHLLS